MASTSQRLAVVRRHAASSVPHIGPKTWREVERASRKARPVTNALLATLAPLAGLVRSLTFDRGSEFAEYALIERALDIKAYFADPYCSWRRESNENTNGLLRHYIPRSRDLAILTDAEVDRIERKLNKRPRQASGFIISSEELPGVQQRAVRFKVESAPFLLSVASEPHDATEPGKDGGIFS